MLAFLIGIAGVTIALLFIILFIKLDDVEETANFARERSLNLKERLFGKNDSLPFSLRLLDSNSKPGILEKDNQRHDHNVNVIINRFKALEDFLKIEYIDEKKIVNGKEGQSFKGYRKKNQK